MLPAQRKELTKLLKTALEFIHGTSSDRSIAESKLLDALALLKRAQERG